MLMRDWVLKHKLYSLKMKYNSSFVWISAERTAISLGRTQLLCRYDEIQICFLSLYIEFSFYIQHKLVMNISSAPQVLS